MKSIHCVLAQGPISADVGRNRDGPIVEDILEGNVDCDGTPLPQQSVPELANVITALQRPLNPATGLPSEALLYTLDIITYKAIFNKAKESTASSPSGIRYGHYIAALDNDLLIAVNANFMQVPFSFRFPLKHWKKSVHCMLQKKAKPYMTKLHIVQFFEADFNSALKYSICRLLHHIE